MISGVHLDVCIQDLAAKILDRHSRRFNGPLTAEILVLSRHVGQDADVYDALLSVTIGNPETA
jgi:hypothetical protein